MTTLMENNAIILFGHPNKSGVKVSDNVADLGLNLLRAEPNALPMFAVPDLPQPRYGDYLYNLSAFIYANVFKKKTSTLSPTFPLGWKAKPAGLMIPPFRPPPLVLAWAVDPPQETIQAIRDKLTVTECVSGGKPALSFHPLSFDGYELAKDYKANIRATAPLGLINIKSMATMRDMVAVITGLLHTHRYPAFVDSDHYHAIAELELKEMGTDKEGDSEMTEEEKKAEHEFAPMEYSAPYNDSDVVPKEHLLINPEIYKDPCPTFLDVKDVDDKLPKGEGLWFPYFEQLAHYDVETVPLFFEEYLCRSLGDTLEDCVLATRLVRGEWGMAGKTAFGKEMTHLVATMKLALRGQCITVPIFRDTTYLGCAVLGAGTTFDIAAKAYRPVTEEKLRQAIRQSDIHQLSLNAISKLVGNKEQREAVLASKSMVELRTVICNAWTTESKKSDLLRYARGLSFPGESHMAVNLGNLKLAFKLLKDVNSNAATLPAKYPIHHSMLLETDYTAIVWSGFGGMAPSFKIPGGQAFDLRKDMQLETKNKEGKLVRQKIVRISVRNKDLDVAIVDLKSMLAEKTIYNPLVVAKARVSQKYQDKLFPGDEGVELLSVLRSACGISLAESSKGKRRAMDSEEEPASKKGRFGDLEDW